VKTKKIKIKTLDESLTDFKKAFRKASKGKGKAAKSKTYFSSLEAARKILTKERFKLLKAIKTLKPKSIYEVAKALNRDFKNVSTDIKFLAEMGLIELKASTGNRKQRKPILLIDHVILEFVI